MAKTLDELQLTPTARKVAEAVQRHFPDVRFSSGRRDPWEQASAMAENIQEAAAWVERTYLVSDPWQEIVDRRLEGLAHEFHSRMLQMSDQELAQVSKHLSGDAFDLDPTPWVDDAGQPNEGGQTLLSFLGTQPEVDKVLTREGGLVRWHVQVRSGG